jgi:tRNA pseudouridine38-40 synthase
VPTIPPPPPDARPEKNFKLTVEYDGTDYCGWQRQPDQRSIQGVMEEVLRHMTREPATLHASGRTDAGVHALGQTAHFKCRTRLSPVELQKGLNRLLPDDIAVSACQSVPLAFHARFDSRWKHYRYRICNQPVRRPVGHRYVWHIFRPLDVAAMTAAARHLVGRHDFKSFENSGSPRSHTVREVMDAAWQTTDGHLVFDIRANGFLRGMVRNIVGTLVAVGMGKWDPDALPQLLKAADRRLAPTTAPPQGLFLMHVQY